MLDPIPTPKENPMKLLIPRSQLKEALAGLAKVVNPRAPVPILACVRLDA